MTSVISQPSRTTLVDVLSRRAEATPEQPVYIALADRLDVEATVDFATLWRRATAVAASLQRGGFTRERVLIACSKPLDAAISFWAALCAGAIPVPVPAVSARHVRRLAAVIDDCQPRGIIGDVPEELREALGSRAPSIESAVRAGDAETAEWTRPAIAASDVAFLQYTSGSTSAQRGVMVTHANLIANAGRLEAAFELGPHSRCVSWLPLFHDMGLIGGALQGVYTGYPTVLLSPRAFVERPLRWMKAVSIHRASVSGGPNFAYDAAADALEASESPDLSLSSWSVAFNGAESVRRRTLERFTAAAERYGFRRTALRPCYGLAEATLLVAAADGAASTVPPLDDARTSVGRPAQNLSVAIVDPATRALLPAGQIGELWVAGDTVAAGYWNQPERTRATFQATLANGAGPYLRTGDLCMLRGGDLVVVERLKDTIIIRGANYYASDIEAAIDACHPALRRNGAVAFAADDGSGERLVVACELDRRAERDPDTAAIAARVRTLVADHFQLAVADVLLVRFAGLPRTTSGKISRSTCRRDYAAGRLAAIASSPESSRPETGQPPQVEKLATGDRETVIEGLSALIGDAVGRFDVPPNAPIGTLGVDSVRLIQLRLAIERGAGAELSYGAMLEQSIEDLAGFVCAAVREGARPPRPATVPARQSVTEAPLSAGQRALWYLHQLNPAGNAYSIVRGMNVLGPLDVAAFRRAWTAVARKHASLRLRVPCADGVPMQRFDSAIECREHDASSWPDAMLEQYVDVLVDTPFDLDNGPLVTLDLFQRSPLERTLVFRAHHIALDLWSLGPLCHDLDSAYRQLTTTGHASLGESEWNYAEYASSQSERSRDDGWQRKVAEWRNRLHDYAQPLALPPMGDRSEVDQARGVVLLEVDPAVDAALNDIARACGATLNAVVTAAFEVVLARYAAQDRFLVGTLVSGRTRPDTEQLVGYCVNLMPLRADVRRRARFADVVRRAGEELAAAIDHADVPFSAVVETLRPERDRSKVPLIRAVCVWQPTALPGGRRLDGFVFNEAGTTLPLGDVQLASRRVREVAPQFDLTLIAGRRGDRLGLLLEHDRSVVDGPNAGRMLQAVRAVLEAAAGNRDVPVGELCLVDEAEYIEATGRWNDTRCDLEGALLVPAAIEQAAARAPLAVAVVHGGRQCTFGDLLARSERYAARLRSMGVGPEARVAVCVERSIEMVIAMVGVLRAGGAYVPLDPDHPIERLTRIIDDAAPAVMIADRAAAARLQHADVVCLLTDEAEASRERVGWPSLSPAHAAYVIYTSGSTGRPKGVVVSHGNVVNLFAGLDRVRPCGPADTCLAFTSIAFDISVLELLWTLARGARVIVGEPFEPAAEIRPVRRAQRRAVGRAIDLSLFYFADSDGASATGKYELLLQGARYADRHGFAAVWTPERHFHSFGGLYPNPAITSAALAVATERVAVRGGSVVLPLHHPLRVAEEWSVVDNLSGGRAGVAFASGWHAEDFVLAPHTYADRKQAMLDRIRDVQALWRGDTIRASLPNGESTMVSIFPKPVQPTLPMWLTSAGSLETFRIAGRLGANVLTHLLGQDAAAVRQAIDAYRAARAEHGLDPDGGIVTLMIHAYVDTSKDRVVARAREPFQRYLRASLDLTSTLIRALNLDLDVQKMSPADVDALIDFATDRYMETSGIFGTADRCVEMFEQLEDIGVDEVACLVDFGVAPADALASVDRIARARDRFVCPAEPVGDGGHGIPRDVTMFQCTPSALAAFLPDAQVAASLGVLETLFIGGEPLPIAVSRQLGHVKRCFNMYGPTETTVWSAAKALSEADEVVTVGGPLANTELHVLDGGLRPVPPSVVGELFIGGDGVSRGYWRAPALTAARFLPDPFTRRPGARLYRTGDVGRRLDDGSIELLGRDDQQVKIRGYRVELGDVEVALGGIDGVRQAVVVKHRDEHRGDELVAYVVPSDRAVFDVARAGERLRTRLPRYMIPALVPVHELPLNVNGKVDRRALAERPLSAAIAAPDREIVAPQNDTEALVLGIWQDVLGRRELSVNDNFFEVGGHSLLVAQVHARIQRTLGRTFPLVALLEHPTVRAVAGFLMSVPEPAAALSADADQRGALQRAALAAQRRRVAALRNASQI